MRLGFPMVTCLADMSLVTDSQLHGINTNHRVGVARV